MFFWNSLPFLIIQRMLAIWSLVSLPFLNPTWTSGSSWFTYCLPGLENFEHYFASVWDECNCEVVCTFFGIAFLWDWNENWTFPIQEPLLSFPNFFWHSECNTYTASSSMIWNNSPGIPSPPLTLFVLMLPKAHLVLHSRMSGSRWVITPSWLSGSWRSF